VPESQDAQLEKLLRRVYVLAEQPLAGIDEAASELATIAGGDVGVMEPAIRRVRAAVDEAGDQRSKQAASLLRRALEIGDWDWPAYEQPEDR
jgi:hypothetical protein